MTLCTPEQLQRTQVLVVGDVMLDRYWYGAVDRISPEAPVPVVRVTCLLYTSPSPRDRQKSRMPSSA